MMKLVLSSLSALMILGSFATTQLPTGKYLVGTMGWTTASAPDATKYTIQTVDPYTGNANVLAITGLPSLESASAFIVESPTSFLVGTKTASAPAEGNIFRVTLQPNTTWKATKFNKTSLGINVSAMAIRGMYLYICGSSVFANNATDAQIVRVDLMDGSVAMHAQFGKTFMPNGASGSAAAMVRIHDTLHVFTFDARPNPAQPNEHWTVTTAMSPKVTKLPDLPLSKRVPRGFASSGALLDPRSNNIIVVGRWGELLWRSPTGADISYEQWPGDLLLGTETGRSQMWRAAAVNMDTYALAFGDHEGASIDERRCNGADPADPFVDNVCKPLRFSDGVYTVSALLHLPSGKMNSYLPVGDGCRGSQDAVPCSYLMSSPVSPNPAFGFTLKTKADHALLLMGLPMNFRLHRFGALDCVLRVNPCLATRTLATVTNDLAEVKFPIPAGLRLRVMTQWVIVDPKNFFKPTLSEARELLIR